MFLLGEGGLSEREADPGFTETFGGVKGGGRPLK